VVEGVSGHVTMHTSLVVRFDYGSVVPWVRSIDGAVHMIAGPNRLRLWSPVQLEGAEMRHRAEFTVRKGDRVPFTLTWYASHAEEPPVIDGLHTALRTTAWWQAWSSQCTYEGDWLDPVRRSVITLKALTYQPTGGIVAAPTTSLPEWPGGVRNWDYRYCWLRDAAWTFRALVDAGYLTEADEWRAWLVRATPDDRDPPQIMYGVEGERELPERQPDWPPGVEGPR